MADLDHTPFSVAIRRDQTELALPRDRRWLEPTLAFLAKRCRHNGFRNDLVQARILLACRETLELVLRRQPQSRRTYSLVLDFIPEVCSLAFTDGMDWADAPRLIDSSERSEPVDRRRLNLIRTLVDDYELAEDGRTLRLRFRRTLPTEARRPSAVPFVNPVEVFPIQVDGSIDYDMAYQAVFRDVTDATVTLLQQQVKIPKRACLGVYGGGRLYFLPARLEWEREPFQGIKEAFFRFAPSTGPEKFPKPRLDAPFEDAQVVDSIDVLVDAAASRPTESQHRRQFERVLFSDRAVTMLDAPDQRPVFARDLSMGGMALITTFSLEVGSRCRVVLKKLDGTTPPLTLKVVRCTPLIDDFFEVGAEFEDAGNPYGVAATT